MTKKDLIEALEQAKDLGATGLSIDKVLELVNQLEQPTTIPGKLAKELSERIANCIDFNAKDFVDLDSAEFEMDYENRITLTSVDLYEETITEHIDAILDEYVDPFEDDE